MHLLNVGQEMTAMNYLDLVKDITQIVFWAVAATVAVLTYRQARRTILQPIRTEVFKLQLQAMSEIMGLFLGKDELSLRSELAFQTLFDVNVCDLCDAYAANFFDVKFDRENRPYNSRDCPMIMRDPDATAEASKSYLQLGATPSAAAVADPRVRAALWAKYGNPIDETGGKPIATTCTSRSRDAIPTQCGSKPVDPSENSGRGRQRNAREVCFPSGARAVFTGLAMEPVYE
jgi:hypothetical protein